MNAKLPRINSNAYCLDRRSNSRVAVFRIRSGRWAVDRATPYAMQSFPTHAEAIAHAQKIARQA